MNQEHHALREATLAWRRNPGTTRDCATEHELLSFYRGELGEARSEMLREHLASCPGCVEAARDARLFLDAVGKKHGVPRAASSGRAWVLAWGALAVVLAVAIGAIVALREGGPLRREAAGRDAATRWAQLEISKPPYPLEVGEPNDPVEDELVWRDEDPAAAGDLDAAMASYLAGDLATAVSALGEHLERAPQDPRALFYRGASLLLQGHANEAARDLALSAALASPEREVLREEALYYLALAHLRAANEPGARAALARVVEESGRHEADARRLLAQLAAQGHAP